MSGVDSAFGPSVDQAKQVLAAGHLWWGWYACGGGAYHNWTKAEIAVLDEAEVPCSLPIFVPAMSGGRISPTANPELDAVRTVWVVGQLGWKDALALDTEASMRYDPWTAEYEARFGDEVAACGWKPATYAGGFTFGNPPKHQPWWIWHGSAPAGECYQNGQANFGGLWVDTNSAGSGFPLAVRT